MSLFMALGQSHIAPTHVFQDTIRNWHRLNASWEMPFRTTTRVGLLGIAANGPERIHIYILYMYIYIDMYT